MKNSRAIERICPERCKGEYCLFKEFAEHIGHSERTLTQMACIEIFKYEESVAQKRELDWGEATKLWVSQGHAETFAELYKEDITPRKLYKQVTKI